ncbi:HEAT repeat domain-containing protein [Glycomyces paridis]|uniref:HEAT repeat domain-containing protein n=1 Tax=Glycomyces paridis TaxID=2126555 RepID=UPI0013053264|nr:hypothetical protein [Glycomyces paridis]
MLAPVPVVELFGVNRLWGYGLIGPAIAATWATGRWQRRRRLARLGTGAPAAPATRTGFWDDDPEPDLADVPETAIGLAVSLDAAAVPAERRDRAMANLVRSIQNETIDADLRVQLIQDLVDLGGKDMAMRLSPVAAASDVDVEVRLEAAEHMSRFSLAEATRALEAIAADPAVDGKYRLDAASALVDCAARPAGIALMQLVTDGSVSEYVRHSAANMLRPVDGSSAALALRHLATSPLVTSRLRIICAEQLAEYNAGDAENALWRLIKGVEAIMDYHLGIDAAEAMHGISPEVGVEAYSVLAADAYFHWFGRIEAAFRLGRLGVRDGFDLLSDFACAEGLDDVYGIAALDRLFQLEIESGTLDQEE